ncbi:MAG: aminotransferase class IV family protein [Sedimentisphaerales bacterium]|nr:aminotransferase class IV family protein [Sedimentisphaerales bacterium]
MNWSFLNSRIIENLQAKVSVSDSGFLYGIGLFETMRCTGGRVFALDDHLDRLLASATVLEIGHPFEKAYLAEAIYKTLEANELTDARIRLTLSGGVMNVSKPEPTLLITATKLEPYPQSFYNKGVKVILTDYRQNPDDPTTGHKTTNFFARLMTLNAAHKKRASEAIWFTPQGLLAEGCISNVFLVKDSVLYTPRLETPVMPGIARKHALQLAREMSIETRETDLTIIRLLEADEVFLTNVIMLVLPVVAIEAHTVGNGAPGSISKKLGSALKKQTEESCPVEGATDEST